MADTLLQLTACEHISKSPHLYPEIAAALTSDLASAKLGVVFADLPYYQDLMQSGLRLVLGKRPVMRHWGQVFHTHRPTTLGLAFAELTQTDAEYVNKPWALAFVAGYFTHLAVDRVLNALSRRVVSENVPTGAEISNFKIFCAHYQSVFFHRELLGHDLIGTKDVRGLAACFREKRGVIDDETQLFLHKACLKAFAQVPDEGEMQTWAAGFQTYSSLLSLSLLKFYRLGENESGQGLLHSFYRNDFFDFSAYFDRAIELAVDYVNTAYAYLKNGDFCAGSREEFFELVPDFDIANPPDDDHFYVNPQEEPPEGDEEPVENIVPFSEPKKPAF